MKRKQKNLPPLIERFELKFTIPFEMVAPISEFAALYCTLDKYSEISESGYYYVNNLYLDSPEYLFLRMRLDGADRRFNMRVRAYGDVDAVLPYYLEIKQKSGNVVKKYRAEVSDLSWHHKYEDSTYGNVEKINDPETLKSRDFFERLTLTYNVRPKVQTQYLRRAWVSDVDDYARVTFDTDLKYLPQDAYRFEKSDRLIPCDMETLFDPGCNVILELKCYAAYVPLWMIDMIRYFDLNRRSFSKYITGITALFEEQNINMGGRIAAFC